MQRGTLFRLLVLVVVLGGMVAAQTGRIRGRVTDAQTGEALVGAAVYIEESMSGAGRAIIVTSVILASGFSVLVFGSFAPSMYFGVVTAAVILIALVADLVLLPAALLVLRKGRQTD